MKRILAIGLFGLIVSCAPMLPGVNRDRVAQRLRNAFLGLPEEITETLAREMPRSIARTIDDQEYDDAAGWFVRCMGLGSHHPDSVQTGPVEYVCVCEHPRELNYTLFLTRKDGAWTNLWDTTFTCHRPGLQLDTVRLGIETGWRPTVQLRGAIGYSGEDEYHLIRWDGTNWRHAIHRFAIGHWRELMDIDGDGIMEVNLPRADDKRGIWRDRVYTYRPAVGQYWLDADGEFPGERGRIEFEARIPKDTFLTHESIWVSFVARNLSRAAFPSNSIWLTSVDIRLQILDQYGERVGGNRFHVSKLPPYFLDWELWHPDDSILSASRIDDNVYVWDSTVADCATPPGEYTAVFSWNYDVFYRPLFGNSPFLEDTIYYTVVEPIGVNVEALEAWLSLDWQNKYQRSNAKQLFDIYARFRNSPFGPMALHKLIQLSQRGYGYYPEGTHPEWFSRELALVYPDHPDLPVILNRFKREHTEKETLALFRDICDSVPNTLAGLLTAGYVFKGNWPW